MPSGNGSGADSSLVAPSRGEFGAEPRELAPRPFGFERLAAYALCSAVVDLRISEVVDVPYPIVSALLPLDVFET